MPASLNQVILIGNLTADPELQYTQSGVARTTFSIAINRQYRDRNDELQEDTTFIPITVWRNQAENCATYLSKGRSVAVVGRIRRRRYETDEGEARWYTEVVARNVQFLGGGRGEGGDKPSQEREEFGGGGGGFEGGGRGGGSQPGGGQTGGEGESDEEDIPF